MNWHNRLTWTQLALRKDLIGCEIGVDKGINAYNILTNLNMKKLYLIDPYFPNSDEYDEFRERGFKEGEYRPSYEYAKNLLSKFDNIGWLIGSTEDMIDKIPDNSLDFCYIDGDHRYKSVMKDIKLCLPKMKKENLSVIGGHDFVNDHLGVVKAWIEVFGREKLFVSNRDVWTIIK